MGVEKKICETCAHYYECGTRLVIHVMDNDIKCTAYNEKATLTDTNAVKAKGFITVECPNCGCKIHVDRTLCADMREEQT